MDRSGRPDAADHLCPARTGPQRRRRARRHHASDRSAVPQHLKILKDAGLVLDERAGPRRIYRVNQTGLDRMRTELDTFWHDALRAYKELVERSDAETANTPEDRPHGGKP
jgi:hypothetical protein